MKYSENILVVSLQIAKDPRREANLLADGARRVLLKRLVLLLDISGMLRLGLLMSLFLLAIPLMLLICFVTSRTSLSRQNVGPGSGKLGIDLSNGGLRGRLDSLSVRFDLGLTSGLHSRLNLAPELGNLGLDDGIASKSRIPAW